MKRTRHTLPLLLCLTLLLMALAFLFVLIRRAEPPPPAPLALPAPSPPSLAPPIIAKSRKESAAPQTIREERSDRETTGASDEFLTPSYPISSLPSQREFSIRTIHSSAILPTDGLSPDTTTALQHAVELYVEQHPGVLIFDLDAKSNSGVPILIFSVPDYDITPQIEALYRPLVAETGEPVAAVD